ncbi:hypothetical protein GCM10010503_19640 [Streptomyces lucensis JCM 4490]|uniref:Uncharacterized protein n=1 Tax=Streptomyces lucensis JCM 4490 TaxID=1306176 RepID=A0A918J1L7_9ACTN|nr:hypothetical protein GCM10010503_19640 [Streptomyces lucensis JCM 4490]
MHDDERAVLAQVQIEFDQVQAGVLRGDEGTKGVLGLDTHDPAVTDGKEVQGSTRFRRRRIGTRVTGGRRRPRGQDRSLMAGTRDDSACARGIGARAGRRLAGIRPGRHPEVGASPLPLTVRFDRMTTVSPHA